MPAMNYKVISTVEKAGDLETHVRLCEIDGVQVVEFRDFIPSLKEYGRGYWLPANRDVLGAMAQAMLAAQSAVA